MKLKSCLKNLNQKLNENLDVMTISIASQIVSVTGSTNFPGQALDFATSGFISGMAILGGRLTGARSKYLEFILAYTPPIIGYFDEYHNLLSHIGLPGGSKTQDPLDVIAYFLGTTFTYGGIKLWEYYKTQTKSS